MNVKEVLETVTTYLLPNSGEVNDQYIKVAKIKGQDLPWHNHENEDELFYIVSRYFWWKSKINNPLHMNQRPFCSQKRN
jgi:hypothetical protein